MTTFSHVPPGFRFHPTDEELVDYYLRKKVASRRIDFDVIKDIDLYKIEPWDLQEKCKIGNEEQSEWYFFSHKDKKYPTGSRTNRATTAGFWKATGRDKSIYSNHNLVGMRKTLVFYKGRAPNGLKSDWIMHEYRLETNENATPQEEGWVVCRVFKKRIASLQKAAGHESPCWYDEQVLLMPEVLDHSPRRISQPQGFGNYHTYSCKKELELHYPNFLENPKLFNPVGAMSSNLAASAYALDVHMRSSALCSSSLIDPGEQMQQKHQSEQMNSVENRSSEQVTDWRVLDKFVASQLSHEDASNESNFSTEGKDFQVPNQLKKLLIHEQSNKTEGAFQYGSTFTSNTEFDLWK